MSWNSTRPHGESYTKDVIDHVDQKHTSADTAQGNAGEHHLYPREATSHESIMAQHGASWAAITHKTPIPFSPSNGLHSVGADHVGCFSKSVNMSGGVRQGPSYTSDPGPGCARASIMDNHLHLDMQKQGTGRTFRSQRGY